MSECLAQRSPAWDELIRRFGPVIYGTIRKQLSRFGCAARKDLIEDAYQEVFLALSRDRMLGRLTDVRALPGYLAAVAVSKAVDAVRSVSREGSYVEWTGARPEPESRQGGPAGAAQAGTMNAVAESDTACPRPNPREAAEERDLRDIVEREIADLPGREALVVRLKWQHDMTLDTIARQMEIPVGTAATILRRTRDRVRERLREKGIEG